VQSKYLRARASELKEIQTSAEQPRASGTLGNKPLVVLTAVQQDESLKAVLSAKDFSRFPENVGANATAQIGTTSVAWEADDSLSDVDHVTQRPEAIVSAINEVYKSSVH
jgi:hypothetical protein